MRSINVICTVQGNSFTIYNAYNQVWLWKSTKNNIIIYTSLLNYTQYYLVFTSVITDIQASLYLCEYIIYVYHLGFYNILSKKIINDMHVRIFLTIENFSFQ